MPEGEEPDKFRDEVMRRMDRMVEYAAGRNVVLLHENEKGIYGDSAARCLDLMKLFYGDHFRCTFDFANFVQCGQDTLEAYEMLRPYISYIHVKDALRENGDVVPAGAGDGNVAEILNRLDEEGYAGFLSLEPHLADFAGLKSLEKEVKERGRTDGKKHSVPHTVPWRSFWADRKIQITIQKTAPAICGLRALFLDYK